MSPPFDVEDGSRPGDPVAGIDRSGNMFAEGNVRIDGDMTIGGALVVAGQAVTPGGAFTTTGDTYVTSGDVTLANVGATWTAVPGLTISIAAAAGDRIRITPKFLFQPGANFLDMAVRGAANALVRYASTGAAAPAVEGDPSMYNNPSTYRCQCGGEWTFTAAAGDIVGGLVTIVLATSGTGGGVVFMGANYPFRWCLDNYGAAT